MFNGWISLHRSILENSELTNDWEILSWIKILLYANFSDSEMKIKNKKIQVIRGQSVYSYSTWAKLLNCNVSKLRRFLTKLENAQMIERENLGQATLLTIVNYDKYQNPNTVNDTVNDTVKPLKNKVYGNICNSVSDNTKTDTKTDTVNDTVKPLNNIVFSGICDTVNDTKTDNNIIRNNNNNNNTRKMQKNQVKLIDEKHEFQDYIFENCPRIQKMDYQLTYNESCKLEKEYGKDLVYEYLENLENYKEKDIEKVYSSVNLTLRNWIKRKIRNLKDAKSKPNYEKRDSFSFEKLEEIINSTTK